MATKNIPENYLDLFEKRAFCHLATLMPNGQPQVNPVWVDYDGEYILINTSRGRQKDRNIQRDPRVTVEISDPDNPYRYLEVRGRVAEAVEEGAVEHIDKLAKKYTGAEKYPHHAPGEVRVIYKIKPEHVLTR
ncbi:MAG: PPOX class F420-dependent oxidoreductase [Anaerolineaceae bacterium]|nr:PPOX class F420-dependent oxidoreductase [Anaerolineaceae bacterium]